MLRSVWMLKALDWDDPSLCWSSPCATKQAAYDQAMEVISEYVEEMVSEDLPDSLKKAVASKNAFQAVEVWNQLNFSPNYEVMEEEIKQISTSVDPPQIVVSQGDVKVLRVNKEHETNKSLVIVIECGTPVKVNKIVRIGKRYTVVLEGRSRGGQLSSVEVSLNGAWNAHYVDEFHEEIRLWVTIVFTLGMHRGVLWDNIGQPLTV